MIAVEICEMSSDRSGSCVRCGVEAQFKFGGKYVCGECYSIAGSCCAGELDSGFLASEEGEDETN